MKKTRKILALALLPCVLLSAAGLAASAWAVDLTTQYVTVFRAGSAPVAQNVELTTYQNIEVYGVLGASDPDGGTVRFTVTTEPKKGSVAVQESGQFVYMPNEGAKGKDSFTYVASDEEGNVSRPATVSIRINKQSGDVFYEDMRGDPAHYAALTLAEKGVYTGEKIGQTYFFRPEEPVTRGRFLAMCMKLCGTPLLRGVTVTGFADDAAIEAWAKSYVSTAVMNGAVSGRRDEAGNLVFDPDGVLTVAEASAILNAVFAVTDVSGAATSVAGMEPALSPEEVQAVCNLTACGILQSSEPVTETLTMARCARMLCDASEKLKR